MVSEGEYACTDTTDPSNVTLRSDITSIINSSETNAVCLGTAEKGTNTIEDFFNRNIECKCRDVPVSNYCVPVPTDAYKMSKVEHSLQQEILKNQSSMIKHESAIPCLCHAQRIACTLPVEYKKDNLQSRSFLCRFNSKWLQKDCSDRKDKTYEVKLKQPQCPRYEKPFVSCELLEGIPDKSKCNSMKPKPPKCQSKQTEKEDQVTEKIDIYYFDHGNSAFYRTTDSPPILATEKCAEKTDQAATRFWAEIFGTIHIGTAFVTAFILQFLRFVLFSIIRPLTVGILQLLADYFIKPFLSIIFNALIQPILILLYNVATSLKDLCEPLAEALGLFLREIANLFRAIRIVEVRNANASSPSACT